MKTVQWNVIIIIIIIIINVVVVVVAYADAYHYWPYLSSNRLFQVYYKVRQHILLQSPGWSVITKCDSFVIIKCGNFIVKWNRFYKLSAAEHSTSQNIQDSGIRSSARGEYLDVYVQRILDVKNNNNEKNKQTNH